MLPTKKLEPALDQVLNAGLKGKGVNNRLAEALSGKRDQPTAQELQAFQRRVNENLANEKAAEDSGDFD